MIKLIAADLDGTLLDSKKRLPDGFFDLIRRMKQQGTVFAAASGRQYFGITKLFEPVIDDVVFIAENGGAVYEGRRLLFSLPMSYDDVRLLVGCAMPLYDKGVRLLLSGEGRSYIFGGDEEFIENCRMYSGDIVTLEDISRLPQDDRIIKLAIFDKNAQECTYPYMKSRCGGFNVILSNTCWVDVVRRDVNKGAAVAQLMKRLKAGFDEAAVFGDYLNDREMMSVCRYGFAMQNAHPELKSAASFIAPSNDENGVVREILRLCPNLK